MKSLKQVDNRTLSCVQFRFSGPFFFFLAGWRAAERERGAKNWPIVSFIWRPAGRAHPTGPGATRRDPGEPAGKLAHELAHHARATIIESRFNYYRYRRRVDP